LRQAFTRQEPRNTRLSLDSRTRTHSKRDCNSNLTSLWFGFGFLLTEHAEHLDMAMCRPRLQPTRSRLHSCTARWCAQSAALPTMCKPRSRRVRHVRRRRRSEHLQILAGLVVPGGRAGQCPGVCQRNARQHCPGEDGIFWRLLVFGVAGDHLRPKQGADPVRD
jgi:hypothetical protein